MEILNDRGHQAQKYLRGKKPRELAAPSNYKHLLSTQCHISAICCGGKWYHSMYCWCTMVPLQYLYVNSPIAMLTKSPCVKVSKIGRQCKGAREAYLHIVFSRKVVMQKKFPYLCSIYLFNYTLYRKSKGTSRAPIKNAIFWYMTHLCRSNTLDYIKVT